MALKCLEIALKRLYQNLPEDPHLDGVIHRCFFIDIGGNTSNLTLLFHVAVLWAYTIVKIGCKIFRKCCKFKKNPLSLLLDLVRGSQFTQQPEFHLGALFHILGPDLSSKIGA